MVLQEIEGITSIFKIKKATLEAFSRPPGRQHFSALDSPSDEDFSSYRSGSRLSSVLLSTK